MMKKFWIVYGMKNTGQFTRYETYQAAEDQAKRLAANDLDNEYVVLEAVAWTKRPVPAIDVVKL